MDNIRNVQQMTDDVQNTEFKPPRKTSHTDFDGIFDIKNPTMPERTFVMEFLQLLLNPDLTEELEEAYRNRWISYVGNPLHSIDVINPNGEVIYTVPPLLTADKPAISPEHMPLFKDLLKDAKEKSAISPILGDQIINGYIDALPNRDKALNPRIAAEWRHILEHYNLVDRISMAYTGKEAPKIDTQSTSAGNEADQSSFNNFDNDEDA